MNDILVYSMERTGPSEKKFELARQRKNFFKSFVSCIYFVCLWFLEKLL